MSKLRWGLGGLALVSILLMATPASASSKTSIKSKGKELFATLTDCPANARPGTQCHGWVADAVQNKLKQDGTVDKEGFLLVDEYAVTITASGYDATYLGTGTGTPKRIQIADNLSRGSVSGALDTLCDPQGNCIAANVPVSFNLTANGKVSSTKGRVVTKFDSCRVIERFDYRSRDAAGKGRIDGQSVVTSPVDPSYIFTSADATIFRGSCPLP